MCGNHYLFSTGDLQQGKETPLIKWSEGTSIEPLLSFLTLNPGN